MRYVLPSLVEIQDGMSFFCVDFTWNYPYNIIICYKNNNYYYFLQAVQYGNKEIVERWMSYNKNQPHRNRERDKHGLAPIHYAAKFTQAEIMRILCEEGEAGT